MEGGTTCREKGEGGSIAEKGKLKCELRRHKGRWEKKKTGVAEISRVRASSGMGRDSEGARSSGGGRLPPDGGETFQGGRGESGDVYVERLGREGKEGITTFFILSKWGGRGTEVLKGKGKERGEALPAPSLTFAVKKKGGGENGEAFFCPRPT